MKAEVEFDDLDGPQQLTLLNTEDDLQRSLAERDVRFSLLTRVRVPRIRTGRCYWPFSLKLLEKGSKFAEERGLTSFEQVFSQWDPTLFAEDSLEAAFDYILPGYTGGWNPRGKPLY